MYRITIKTLWIFILAAWIAVGSHGDAACGVCFITDAARDGGVVHRFEVGTDGLSLDQAITLDTSLGLPPRLLGWF